MVLMGWIIRVIVVLFAVRLVLRLIAGLVRQPAAQRPASKPSTREGGHLVRDPNCGTYVPIGRALKSGAGDHTVYFCSDACRSAWAARKTG